MTFPPESVEEDLATGLVGLPVDFAAAILARGLEAKWAALPSDDQAHIAALIDEVEGATRQERTDAVLEYVLPSEVATR